MQKLFIRLGKIFIIGLFIALAFPLLVNVVFFGKSIFLQHAIPAFYYGIGLIVSSALIISVLILMRMFIRTMRLTGLNEVKFIIILLSGTLLLSLVSIFLIDSVPEGDFLAYQRNAIKISQGDYTFSHLMGQLGNVYLRRPLVNLAPLYMITGPDLMVLQLFNALINIVTGLLLYYYVRQSFKNHLIARVTLIFYFLMPIIYLTLNIPSHDIPGLFYLMICCVLFERAHHFVMTGRNVLLLLVFSVLLGFFIFILQISRSIGLFCFYALFVFMMISLLEFLPRAGAWKNYMPMAKKILFLFILPMAVYYLLTSFLISSNINQGRFIMMFIATDTSADKEGAYREIADNKIYYHSMPVKHRSDMAQGKFRSELFYNYTDFIKLFLKKSNRLYNLGVDKSWARGDKNNLKIQVLTGLVWLVHPVIRIFYFVLAIAGLIYLFRKYRPGNPFTFLLFYWLIASVLLIMIGEVSPRYSYLFIPGIVTLAAAGYLALPVLYRNFTRALRYRSGKVLIGIGGWSVFTVVILLLLAGLGHYLNRKMESDNLVYRDLRDPAITVSPDDLNQEEILSRGLTPQEAPLKFGFRLIPGADSVMARWSYPVEAGALYQVRCFLREKSGRPSGYQADLWIDGQYTVQDSTEGRREHNLRIMKDHTVRYLSSALIFVKEDSLDIELRLAAKEGLVTDEHESELSVTFLDFLQIIKKTP